MDEIESLCRLCEAVETAGADIAPTYVSTQFRASPFERALFSALNRVLLIN